MLMYDAIGDACARDAWLVDGPVEQTSLSYWCGRFYRTTGMKRRCWPAGVKVACSFPRAEGSYTPNMRRLCFSLRVRLHK